MSVTNDSLMQSTKTIPRFLEESTIGPYKLKKTIGSGELSEVKLAQHMDTGEEVAIKIIDRTNLRIDQIQKLYREIKLMKKLDHPNIVKLLDVIETTKKMCLVMEYVRGGDLFEYLDECGYVSEKETRAILRQIVSAVHYCHQNGVVHRDLKVENILIDNRMNVKLADFGLSNVLLPGQKLNTMCGTPAYTAPEVFQGKPYGSEVDVWSLGIILYYLVTGDMPFDDSSLQQAKKEILSGVYNIPHNLSTDCKNLIRKILVLEPERRPSLLSIMEDKWINHGYKEVLKPYVF